MKKIKFGFFLLVLTLVIFACNRNNDETTGEKEATKVSKLKTAQTNRLGENVKVESISENLFMYGAKSYTVSNDKITFETYRDFNVDDKVGNLSTYDFKIEENKVSLGTKYITLDDKNVVLKTENNLFVIDENLNFSSLDLESRLLLIIFTELNSSEKGKDSYNNHVNRIYTGGGGCSWINTYYVTGWGYTPGAASADYNWNLSHGALPGGKSCTALGGAHMVENEIELFIVTVHWFQQNRAFCCL
ncbi:MULTISPECIES: hypothetical protein [Chryseobacterium]|uniref:hypothetical protein n=1 Tax=Chryseobacterium TaxID=59732 RepID=UPI000F4DA0B2|nr:MULTISPECIES: hypothetical protein [Chryseobacterium]WBX95564.1 hypothetical protein PE065_11825 [Chryseobacterium gambrini]